jgi:hypothetical protein
MKNNENLKFWNECQPLLVTGAKEKIEQMDEDQALEVVKLFYSDQTDSAMAVLTKDSWLPAKGIIEFLLNKYDTLKPIVIDWWIGIEKKAADKWMKEYGQQLF